MTSPTSVKSDRRAVRDQDALSAKLQNKTVGELQKIWLELYGVPTRTRNKPYLRKKLEFRQQELKSGGLSPLAIAKSDELVKEHGEQEVARRVSRKKSAAYRLAPATTERPRDARLPKAGTTLVREYHGKSYQLVVHDRDFEYEGKRYGSLSTVAREVTGQVWNGFLFWGLKPAASKG